MVSTCSEWSNSNAAGRVEQVTPATSPETLLLAGLQLLLDALASLGRKPVRWLTLQVFLALMGSRAQEFQLRSISAAPFAKEKMHAQAESLRQREFAIHCF